MLYYKLQALHSADQGNPSVQVNIKSMHKKNLIKRKRHKVFWCTRKNASLSSVKDVSVFVEESSENVETGLETLLYPQVWKVKLHPSMNCLEVLCDHSHLLYVYPPHCWWIGKNSIKQGNTRYSGQRHRNVGI